MFSLEITKYKIIITIKNKPQKQSSSKFVILRYEIYRGNPLFNWGKWGGYKYNMICNISPKKYFYENISLL